MLRYPMLAFIRRSLTEILPIDMVEGLEKSPGNRTLRGRVSKLHVSDCSSHQSTWTISTEPGLVGLVRDLGATQQVGVLFKHRDKTMS